MRNHRLAGIYLIKCTPPGSLPLYYIGQSQNVNSRIQQHRYALKYGRHFNSKMQRHWRVYGASSFSFSIIQTCSIQDLDEYELWWLQEMVDHPRCFNVGTDPVSPFRGRKFSEEHRRKIAAAISGPKHYNFGKPLSLKHRSAISAAGRGLKRSEVTRHRISMANKGPCNSMFGKYGSLNPRSKSVEGVHIVTGHTVAFESATLAESHGFRQEEISKVCNGKRKSHRGYVWRFTQASGG